MAIFVVQIMRKVNNAYLKLEATLELWQVICFFWHSSNTQQVCMVCWKVSMKIKT